MLGAGDAAIAHRADVGPARTADACAAVFLRRARIEDDGVGVVERGQHIVAVDAHAFAPRHRLVRHRRRRLGDFGGQRAAFRLPAVAAAVEHAHVGVAAIAERPPGIEAELDAFAVEDHGGVVTDAVRTELGGEVFRRGEFPHRRVPQHVLPFPAQGAGHVAGLVGGHLVLPEAGDLDQLDLGIVGIGRQPFGGNQHRCIDSGVHGHSSG